MRYIVPLSAILISGLAQFGRCASTQPTPVSESVSRLLETSRVSSPAVYRQLEDDVIAKLASGDKATTDAVFAEIEDISKFSTWFASEDGAGKVNVPRKVVAMSLAVHSERFIRFARELFKTNFYTGAERQILRAYVYSLMLHGQVHQVRSELVRIAREGTTYNIRICAAILVGLGSSGMTATGKELPEFHRDALDELASPELGACLLQKIFAMDGGMVDSWSKEMTEARTAYAVEVGLINVVWNLSPISQDPEAFLQKASAAAMKVDGTNGKWRTNIDLYVNEKGILSEGDAAQQTTDAILQMPFAADPQSLKKLHNWYANIKNDVLKSEIELRLETIRADSKLFVPSKSIVGRLLVLFAKTKEFPEWCERQMLDARSSEVSQFLATLYFCVRMRNETNAPNWNHFTSDMLEFTKRSKISLAARLRILAICGDKDAAYAAVQSAGIDYDAYKWQIFRDAAPAYCGLLADSVDFGQFVSMTQGTGAQLNLDYTSFFRLLDDKRKASVFQQTMDGFARQTGRANQWNRLIQVEAKTSNKIP